MSPPAVVLRNGGGTPTSSHLPGARRGLGWVPPPMSTLRQLGRRVERRRLISRQRFSACRPRLYTLDAEGQPDYADPPGQRGQPAGDPSGRCPWIHRDPAGPAGGFMADPDGWPPGRPPPQPADRVRWEARLCPVESPFRGPEHPPHEIIRTWLSPGGARALENTRCPGIADDRGFVMDRTARRGAVQGQHGGADRVLERYGRTPCVAGGQGAARPGLAVRRGRD